MKKILLLFLSLFYVYSQDIASIMKKVNKQSHLYDATYNMSIVSTDRYGTKRISMIVKVLDDNSLFEFTSKAEKGQKILLQNREVTLYFPEADESIKLSGVELGQKITGTSINFDNLDDFNVDDFTYELENIKYNNKDAFKIIASAKKKNEFSHPKAIFIIDPLTYELFKEEKYTINNRLSQTFLILKSQKIDEYIIPVEMKIQDNVLKKSSSTIIITNIKTKQNLNLVSFKI